MTQSTVVISATDDITVRLGNLAQHLAEDREYPPHAMSDLGEASSLIQRLRSALAALDHAVCGETGFANAVRLDSGTAYPWPALDAAEVLVRPLRSALAPQPSDVVPAFWAVWSETGHHIGVWLNEADARSSLHKYEAHWPQVKGTVKPLYTHPSKATGVEEPSDVHVEGR